MTTHAFCDACLLEKNCYADELWQQKFLQILHHVLDPKIGVEKWTQKWCQNLTPKMERSSLVGHRGLNCAENSGFQNTCKTGNQKHNKATNPPNPKHNTKQKEHGKCLECETRGEKRVKRPKRPNALICRTPGGSIRYPLSCSLGMMLISHSIVSIPASPSRFAI